MNYMNKILGILLLPLPLLAQTEKAIESTLKPVEKFFENYCVSCHGPDKQKGQVRLDTIKWKINDNDSAQRWQDILDQLNGGDMPPFDEKQPPHAELKQALAAITAHVDKARRDLADNHGEIKMRRLNRREYRNSVYDLLGFKVPENLLPEDIESENFDTVGEDQMFSSMHLETYLEAGKKAADQALRWIPAPHRELKVQRIDPSASVVKRYQEVVAKGDRQMAQKKAGKSWKEMGFKDAGDAEILFRQFWIRVDLPRRYLQMPLAKEGVYLTSLNNGRDAQGVIHIDPRGTYKFRLRGGYVGNPIEERKIVRLENVQKNFGYSKDAFMLLPYLKPELTC